MNTLLCIEQAPEQLNLDTLNNKTPIRGKLSFYWSSLNFHPHGRNVIMFLMIKVGGRAAPVTRSGGIRL